MQAMPDVREKILIRINASSAFVLLRSDFADLGNTFWVFASS